MLDSLFRNKHTRKELKYYVYSVLIPCKLEFMLDTMAKVQVSQRKLVYS